jgi:hypothetical protein
LVQLQCTPNHTGKQWHQFKRRKINVNLNIFSLGKNPLWPAWKGGYWCNTRGNWSETQYITCIHIGMILLHTVGSYYDIFSLRNMYNLAAGDLQQAIIISLYHQNCQAQITHWEA